MISRVGRTKFMVAVIAVCFLIANSAYAADTTRTPVPPQPKFTATLVNNKTGHVIDVPLKTSTVMREHKTYPNGVSITKYHTTVQVAATSDHKEVGGNDPGLSYESTAHLDFLYYQQGVNTYATITGGWGEWTRLDPQATVSNANVLIHQSDVVHDNRNATSVGVPIDGQHYAVAPNGSWPYVNVSCTPCYLLAQTNITFQDFSSTYTWNMNAVFGNYTLPPPV